MTFPTPREGRPVPPGPYEGVPAHLARSLFTWLQGRMAVNHYGVAFNSELLQLVMATCQLAYSSPRGNAGYKALREYCAASQETFLDVVHYTLQCADDVAAKDLDQYLVAGQSVWTATAKGLERRISGVAMESFAKATAVHDDATDALTEAWDKVYGRKPDPSDAWDHSIKAIEEALKPIICANDRNATLGTITGALKADPRKWTLALGGNRVGSKGSNGVEALETMLRLVWPNPDRHGGNPRKPAQLEALAVVHLAVAIVQWARDGVLAKV